MAENIQVDVKKLSFERAIEELETIVKRLEDGKVPLEESVAIYERGEALKRRCEELLRQAEARVEKITTDASGQADRRRVARRTVIGRSWPGMTKTIVPRFCPLEMSANAPKLGTLGTFSPRRTVEPTRLGASATFGFPRGISGLALASALV